MPTSRILNANGFVLVELLIAMTILAGSVTILHTIYANLVAKQIKLQKVHADLIENANQAEIQIAQIVYRKYCNDPAILHHCAHSRRSDDLPTVEAIERCNAQTP
jgi:prepilin-type N-terminal cleavage/methylation domain-containing protein